MSKVTLCRQADRQYAPLFEGARGARIARFPGRDFSTTLGGGIVEMENFYLPWTFHYDEVLLTLEGEWDFHVGDETFTNRPGDLLWIPDKTEAIYESKGRSVVYASTYPIDWQDRLKQD